MGIELATPVREMTTPELSAATQPALLSNHKYCLVYLKDGFPSQAEDEVLQKLAQQYADKADAAEMPLTFAWMNMRAERKMKALFDPPVLPSAVMLDLVGNEESGHKPRYALMLHPEEDGDPVPASVASLELLLDTVLGGDAMFIPVSEKKFSSSWAK